ncbi:MAG: PEP-CTERM sorting domain-containing protein [Verrucomicrobiota bacterium]|nr:PEP-CTERM sorting domain-containing protein [Verrucomicrobiota bacterium]
MSACILLTIAAFAGGLFLAHFSAARLLSRTVSGMPLAPELIYLPPEIARVERTPVSSVVADSVTSASSSETPARSQQHRTAAETQVDLASQSVAPRTDVAQQPAAQEKLQLRAIAETLTESARYSLAARSQSSTTSSDPLMHDYQGVELSVVPEPSSVIGIIALLAVVIVSGRRRWVRDLARPASLVT